MRILAFGSFHRRQRDVAVAWGSLVCRAGCWATAHEVVGCSMLSLTPSCGKPVQVAKVDDKGKTTTMTKEQVVRGKRLFNAACASCHVGGGTRTNQNVGLAIEELSGATPNRATVEGIVDYINNPTTYDGLKAWAEGGVDEV